MAQVVPRLRALEAQQQRHAAERDDQAVPRLRVGLVEVRVLARGGGERGVEQVV